jgi:predicted amidohydrolase YtcJ
MRRAVVLLFPGLVSLAASARPADPRGPADLLLEGGRVVTLEPGRPAVSAVAVKGGRVVALGEPAELAGWRGPATRRVDLQGKLVLPGLTDAHLHVESLGETRETLDLVGAASLEEALGRVARRAAATPAAGWVRGRGWDQNDWPGQAFPTAADLDRVSGGRPVFLERVDGHAAWVSTRALELASVTSATPDPPGGRILRAAGGAPTGVLVDAAADLVAARIPPATPLERKRRLEAGLKAAAEAGLTSVHDAGVDGETVDLYKQLLAEGRLPIRVYAMRRGPQDFLALGPGLRPDVGLGDGLLTVRAIKVMADGALGSRGAFMLEPYADDPGNRGLATVDWDALDRLVKAALAQGFQVATHAIGDAANRKVLDAYERGFGPGGGAAHRFRIEHVQVVSPPDVPRLKALGVIPSMQPTHCTSDMYWATDRVGKERAKGAYLWRSFLRQGLPLPAGSDAPVEDVSVLRGLFAAVTRQDAQGWPEGGWHPEERVSLLEAIAMFSRDAAFAAFEEGDRGTIAVGKRADFTVLDRDLTSAPPAELLAARVVMTVVGGRVAHEVR